MEMCQLDQRGRQSNETAWKSEIDQLFTSFEQHYVVFRLCGNCLGHGQLHKYKKVLEL